MLLLTTPALSNRNLWYQSHGTRTLTIVKEIMKLMTFFLPIRKRIDNIVTYV